jgi:hypothetical protein
MTEVRGSHAYGLRGDMSDQTVTVRIGGREVTGPAYDPGVKPKAEPVKVDPYPTSSGYILTNLDADALYQEMRLRVPQEWLRMGCNVVYKSDHGTDIYRIAVEDWNMAIDVLIDDLTKMKVEAE